MSSTPSRGRAGPSTVSEVKHLTAIRTDDRPLLFSLFEVEAKVASVVVAPSSNPAPSARRSRVNPNQQPKMVFISTPSTPKETYRKASSVRAPAIHRRVHDISYHILCINLLGVKSTSVSRLPLPSKMLAPTRTRDPNIVAGTSESRGRARRRGTSHSEPRASERALLSLLSARVHECIAEKQEHAIWGVSVHT